jgi:hypothetical protein
VFQAVADVGGVGGPVSGGGALPGDGDAVVDAEQAGEDGGGQVGGELEQRGGSGLPGADAELAQAFGELVGADGLPGLATGEQPGRGARVADGGVPVAGRDQLLDQGVEGFGEDDRLVAEPDPRLVIAGVDMAEGEVADRGWPLGVKENE